MPSSLIIVALAAAWLVVLVPMIARKRQEVTQTNDSALAARVVRSGSSRSEGRKEFAVTEDATSADDRRDDEDLVEDDYDAELDDEFHEDLDDEGDETFDERHRDYVESEPELERAYAEDGERVRRYRPGRGGFDPEAAEIAAKAKYAYRQRVVLALIAGAVLTAIVAIAMLPIVWWLHAIVDLGLIGYLVYLRRQVRIEEEIRDRRLARLNATAPAAPAPARRRPRAEPVEEVEVAQPDPREVVGAERRPVPMSRIRRNAVVVDLEDEDPAFHELEDPGQLPYRKAAGE